MGPQQTEIPVDELNEDVLDDVLRCLPSHGRTVCAKSVASSGQNYGSISGDKGIPGTTTAIKTLSEKFIHNTDDTEGER